MDTVTLQANAKINLGLDVLRRRPDGYHEVKMVMQTIGISDRLTFVRTADPGILIRTDREELPCGEGNLIWKAVRRMQERYGIGGGVQVRLEKQIPIAAGMAGGSADAAAAIHAVDALYELGLRLEEKQAVGVKIGADVPYCLMGGTALAEGIGETLTPLPMPPAAYLVVTKPALSVSTKFVYENLHADRLTVHPDIDGVVSCIWNGDLAGMAARLSNVLETVTAKRYPVIEERKAFLKAHGALAALMSGSGPTVFGIFESEETAREAYECLRAEAVSDEVFLTGFSA